ncbi:unnamed protein product [Dovyalis caffra]|uniref:BURP domain-containing protein n=1 Tax=Dovyalis caffra TaxID=77055 RepID=A0AAV1SR02_9ROSI|nr:unnamed protein product [Dovyalis caffra]
MKNKNDDAKDDLSKEHYIISLDNKESKNSFSEDGMVIMNNWMDAAKGDFSDVAGFYLPGDLYPGRRMKMDFRNVGSKVGFLPRQTAQSIPFSSDNIPKILDLFSIKAGSEEAKTIADVIDLCEVPKMEGEEKFCPQSLESMIDFAVTRFGQIGRVLSSQPGKKQEYIVLKAPQRIGDRALVCHKNVYPYALYYCHEMKGTKAYTVPLLGADGTRIKVVTICHEETSAWNPKELAFQILKAKPGMTICHFLASDTLVWVPPKDPGHEFVPHLSKPVMDQ